jgi:hypothetical protein
MTDGKYKRVCIVVTGYRQIRSVTWRQTCPLHLGTQCRMMLGFVDDFEAMLNTLPYLPVGRCSHYQLMNMTSAKRIRDLYSLDTCRH